MKGVGFWFRVWGLGCLGCSLCDQAMRLHEDSENDNSGYGIAAERKRNTLIDIDLRMANTMPAVFKSWLKSPDSGQTEASTRKKIKSSETQCGPFPSGFRIWI